MEKNNVASKSATQPKWPEIRLAIGVYLLLFALNALRVLFLPWEAHLSMSGTIGDIGATLLELLIKGCIWIGLPYVVITYGEKRNFWEVCQLRQHTIKGLLIGTICASIVFATQIWPVLFLQHPVSTLPTQLFVTVPLIAAGIIEEFAFRGYFLDKLLGWMDDIYAMGLSALLFVLMHIPIWMESGSSPAGLLWSALAILPIAIFLAGAVVWSKSLWSSIVLHTAYNFFQMIFH